MGEPKDRREYMRRWRAENPERVKAYSAARTVRRMAEEMKKAATASGINREATGNAETASSNTKSSAIDGEITIKIGADWKKIQATETVERASEWVELNPAPWSWICSQALDDCLAERRFSMHTIVGNARKIDWGVDSLGKPVHFNNSYVPVWARLFLAQHPEAGEYMETRSSLVDEVMRDAQ